MDVISDYLRSETQEEVFLEQLADSRICSRRRNSVQTSETYMWIKIGCKIWYGKLHDFLFQKVVKKSANELCLFTRKEQDKFLYVLM